MYNVEIGIQMHDGTQYRTIIELPMVAHPSAHRSIIKALGLQTVSLAECVLDITYSIYIKTRHDFWVDSYSDDDEETLIKKHAQQLVYARGRAENIKTFSALPITPFGDIRTRWNLYV